MKIEAVDQFLGNAKKWKEEMTLLREICLNCGLTEEFKWMHPCYTFQGNNIVLIHGFKKYVALLFHKGALLKDNNIVLIQQTKNVQAARQIRFTSTLAVDDLRPVITAYIFEAIEIEKAGLEVTMKKTEEFEMPNELKKTLKDDPEFAIAYRALTPGRQRGYLLHFSQPKQSKTRISRIEKSKDKIFKGKGFNER